MTFHEINTMINLHILTQEDVVVEGLKNLPKPDKVGDVPIPSTIADLTFGQLIMLMSFTGEDSFVEQACKTFGIEDADTEDAYEMWGFLMWLQKQVTKAVEKFAKCSIPLTPEEVMAGAKNIKHDWFNTIDWFACRMHITHEAAENTNWMNVLRCLQIDTDRQKYERRFRRQQELKMKAKK